MSLPESHPPPWLAPARDLWLPREDRALRVTAHLGGPIATDRADGLRLDGALTWVVVALTARMPPQEAFAGVPLGAWVDIPTPITDVDLGGWRVPACSDAELPPVATEGVRRRRRRTDADALGLRKVQTNGGPWKSLDIPTPTVQTPTLTWWLRGDEERLRALLAELHALGRGRAGGLGAVLAWEVERTGEDRSLTREDGSPARPLPVESYADALTRYPTADVREAATRPPYWHQATRTLCACPASQ